MWEVTIKHAKTCEIGHKSHIFRRRDGLSVVMNSICQVLRIETNGQVYSTREISYHFHRGYIENLVKEAHENWNMLEVVEGIIHEPALLTQGEIMDQQNPINAHQGMMIKGNEQNGYQTDDKSMISTVGCYLPSTEQMDCTDWMHVNTPFLYGAVDNSNRASNSECSSDGDFASQGL
ncbi:hypothetical protein TIFTF001_025888 [Ficus carica]|uniref:Calmodulin binding protein C-terminal domain-containing protein n=1 Tax=Ficus carica TaxID=3494 RepID=A0AA88B1N9_FICCA|nr:hypothetical protein TIFTF001_025888 [Ficus carica]